MSKDLYPSVTIVAGPIRPAWGLAVMSGHMLRIHDGTTYIHIDPETTRQWIGVLAEIARQRTHEPKNLLHHQGPTDR